MREFSASLIRPAAIKSLSLFLLELYCRPLLQLCRGGGSLHEMATLAAAARSKRQFRGAKKTRNEGMQMIGFASANVPPGKNQFSDTFPSRFSAAATLGSIATWVVSCCVSVCVYVVRRPTGPKIWIIGIVTCGGAICFEKSPNRHSLARRTIVHTHTPCYGCSRSNGHPLNCCRRSRRFSGLCNFHLPTDNLLETSDDVKILSPEIEGKLWRRRRRRRRGGNDLPLSNLSKLPKAARERSATLISDVEIRESGQLSTF